MKAQANKKLLLPRDLSWSSMQMLEKDERRWVKKYILGENIKFSNSGIEFGKKIADFLESDEENDNFSWEVIKAKLTRYEVSEMPIKTVLNTQYGEIPLTGKMDTGRANLEAFREVKTGRGEAWNQEKANNHGQLYFYATIIFNLTNKIPDVHLDWIKTQEINGVVQLTGEIVPFKIEITHMDIIKMRARIIKNARRIDYLVRQHMKTL